MGWCLQHHLRINWDFQKGQNTVVKPSRIEERWALWVNPSRIRMVTDCQCQQGYTVRDERTKEEASRMKQQSPKSDRVQKRMQKKKEERGEKKVQEPYSNSQISLAVHKELLQQLAR